MAVGLVFLAFLLKTEVMKNTGGSQSTQKTPAQGNRQRPDVRDDLDSRKNEEQDTKGDDVTHNKKDVQNERKGKNQQND